VTRADALRAVALDLDGLVGAGELAGWALCGGLALAVWGAPRATLDIDVLADVAEGRSASAAAEALVRKGWTLVEHARHPAIPCRSWCG
jgi:hypothetical protein